MELKKKREAEEKAREREEEAKLEKRIQVRGYTVMAWKSSFL